jgi:hypothetical protein
LSDARAFLARCTISGDGGRVAKALPNMFEGLVASVGGGFLLFFLFLDFTLLLVVVQALRRPTH